MFFFSPLCSRYMLLGSFLFGLVTSVAFGQHVIYSNDFSNPSDWTMTNTSSPSRNWIISISLPSNLTNQGFPGTINSTSGGNFAWIDSDGAPGGTQDASLTLVNSVDCSGYLTVKLTFQNYHRRFMETHTVQVSNDNGASWTEYPVNAGYLTNTSSPNPETVSLDISAVAANQENVRIRFRYRGAWDWFWAIDDVALVSDIAPTISAFSPHSAVAGSSITISGEHFNTTAADNIVYFGGVKATVTSATATSLTVTVPAGASYAPITVLNTGNGLSAMSPQSFHPIFLPNKDNITSNDIAPQENMPTGDQPITVAYGDLDGDGKPDMAVANATGHSISVFLNTGNAGNVSFTRQDISLGGSATVFGLIIGDIDGDGKPDLAATVTNGNYVSVHRNISTGPGNIAFEAGVQFPVQSSPVNLAIGDIDGDGRADLATANGGSNSFSILRNTGSPGTVNFAAHASYATGSTQPDGIMISDINQDGRTDIIIANKGSNSISIFPNNSDPDSFVFDVQYDAIAGAVPTSIAIGDLDGDGMPDIAVTNQTGDNISVFRNTGSAGGVVSLDAALTFAAGDQPMGISIGDINGDGKADLVVANYRSDDVTVLRNASSGTTMDFVNDLSLPSAGLETRSVVLTDVDGDGKPDITVLAQASNMVSVFLNKLITAPVTQASNITITDITTQTATISWTNGNGDKRVVFVKEEHTGLAAPVDGTDYSANTVFSSGDQIGSNGWYAVYNGTGSTVDITGLDPSTDYRVMVTEYNDTSPVDGAQFQIATATDNPVNFTTRAMLNSITRVHSSSTNRATVDYTVTFGSPISGLSISNFSLSTTGTINTASVVSVTAISSSKYTITVNTGTGDGNITLRLVNASGISPGLDNTLPVNGETYTMDRTPPTAPTNLSAAFGNQQNVLNWTAGTAADLASYQVYGGTSASPTTLLQTVTAPTTTYTHAGLTNGITYYYRIVAMDQLGNSSTYSNEVSAIPKAPQVITFGPLSSKTYGDADFAPGATSTNNTIAITYTSSNTAIAQIVDGNIHIVGVGTTTITASQAAGTAFTAAADVTQSLTVTPATLTVTANTGQSKVYGDSDPVLTYTATGFKRGENSSVFSGALSRTSGENVLNYAITQGTLSAGDNYTISFTTGRAFAITPATLTVTANTGQSKVYGDSDPVLTYTTTGFKRTDTQGIMTGSLVRAGGEDAGNYTIRQGSVSAGRNYTITYTGADFVIHKAPQTISFVSPGTLSRDAGTVDLDVEASSGLPVALTIDDDMIATVNSTALTMTVSRLGTVILTATQEGNHNYLPAAPVSVTVRIANDANARLPIRVHRAVSPNGDGINEFLQLEGIRDYPENKVTIFDKSGKVLAEIESYDNRDNVFTGQTVRDGTYYYYLDIKDGGEWKREKGFFVVRR